MIKLLELRTERELSQRQMAKALNISQGTYYNWENNITQPSIEQLLTLAKFFGVSVDYLIGNSDDFGVIKYDELFEDKKSILSLYNAAPPDIQQAVRTILEEFKKK